MLVLKAILKTIWLCASWLTDLQNVHNISNNAMKCRPHDNINRWYIFSKRLSRCTYWCIPFNDEVQKLRMAVLSQKPFPPPPKQDCERRNVKCFYHPPHAHFTSTPTLSKILITFIVNVIACVTWHYKKTNSKQLTALDTADEKTNLSVQKCLVAAPLPRGASSVPTQTQTPYLRSITMTRKRDPLTSIPSLRE